MNSGLKLQLFTCAGNYQALVCAWSYGGLVCQVCLHLNVIYIISFTTQSSCDTVICQHG